MIETWHGGRNAADLMTMSFAKIILNVLTARLSSGWNKIFPQASDSQLKRVLFLLS